MVAMKGKDGSQALRNFTRAKILEVYFARIDGRIPNSIPSEEKVLFDIDLRMMKDYLLGHHPQDKILEKLVRMISA